MPSKDILVQLLVGLAVAALWGFVQGENMSVLGTLQIGFFEVAFLVALCGVILMYHLVLPWLNRLLFESTRRDLEDFKALQEEAVAVRRGYIYNHARDPDPDPDQPSRRDGGGTKDRPSPGARFADPP